MTTNNTNQTSTIGLHEAIGYKSDINSKTLQTVLDQRLHIADDIHRPRLEEWKDEIIFWENYSTFYKNLEKTGPYYDLCDVVESMIDPQPGSTWLDVGCGPGGMSKIIWHKSRRSVKKIVGTDLVIHPNHKNKDSDFSDMPLELICANAGENTNFDVNVFDGIVSNLVYPYIFDYHGLRGKDALQATLQEAHRILKPGGQLIWSTPKKDVNFWWVFLASVPAMLNIVEYFKGDFTRFYQGVPIIRHALDIQRKGKNGTYTFLDPDEAIAMMRELGFESIESKLTFARQAWVYKAKKLM